MDVSFLSALEALKKGGIIIFPTETSYGMGADPRLPDAVKKIFALKGRDPSKPLLLVASTLEQIKSLVQWSPRAQALADRYWPGALTLVLPLKEGVVLAPGVASAGEVAIRLSSSPFVRELVDAYGFPIIATSANRSGESPCMSYKTAYEVFSNEDVTIVDGGDLVPSLPSTIVRVPAEGACEVIRQGAVDISPKHL